MKHNIACRGKSSKRTSDSNVGKLPLYFKCSFCWYFHKIIWWFYFNEISNSSIFASLPVYYFGQNLPASLYILPSPSIWNLRVCFRESQNQRAINNLQTLEIWIYYLFPSLLNVSFISCNISSKFSKIFF